MSPTKTATDDADESLKRLGGGRWQTRDERFTIEPQSGTWAVVDAEETDDLGLPLVRGPFRSLTDAKAAIAGRPLERPGGIAARGPDRARSRDPEAEAQGRTGARAGAQTRRVEGARGHAEGRRRRRHRDEARGRVGCRAVGAGWMRDLEPSERGRARRLIERLTSDGVPDAGIHRTA
jgi:hypothetical protein